MNAPHLPSQPEFTLRTLRHGGTDRRSRRLAGVLALLAVGVGLAVGKRQLDRRAAKARTRARRFALACDEPLSDGLRRMALGQLELAIELVEDPEQVDVEQAVHEIRKAIKRLRAILRMTRTQFSRRQYSEANRTLSNCARRLAEIRDADVMLRTLQTLIEEDRKRLAGRTSVRRLSNRLRGEVDDAREHLLTVASIRAEVLSDLRRIRDWARTWDLDDRGLELIASQLRSTYRLGRRAGRRAARRMASPAMHTWRKRVKDLRYATEMIQREQPEKQRRTRAYARAADRIGELLGEERDLALLGERLKRNRELFAADRNSYRRLRKLIVRRRRKLRKRALQGGRKLYRKPPKAFVKELAREFARS